MENAEPLSHAAKALLDLNRLPLAREVAAVALANDPGLGAAHSVMAAILDELGAGEDALEHWRQAARLLPNAPQHRLNLGLALLARGDYPAGLPLYEARLDKPDWVSAATRASIAARRNLRLRPGDPVAGRHLVVFTEQGLGDCILFARYLPLLAEAGARITLVCKPALRPLFERIAGIATLLTPPPDQPFAKINLLAIEFDAWLPLLSLPLHFATTPATAPARIPYLLPDPDSVATWRRRYQSAGHTGARKVGLVFHANPESASCVDRSIPISELVPLAAVPGIDFVNLQFGPPGRALMAALPGAIDAMNDAVPLDQFAAATAATDLLITIDTMAAHCAGAIGHPAWLAVPRPPHWFWGAADASPPAHSQWYPAITIFRQTERRNWSAPLRDIALRLTAFAATPKVSVR